MFPHNICLKITQRSINEEEISRLETGTHLEKKCLLETRFCNSRTFVKYDLHILFWYSEHVDFVSALYVHCFICFVSSKQCDINCPCLSYLHANVYIEKCRVVNAICTNALYTPCAKFLALYYAIPLLWICVSKVLSSTGYL